MLVAVILLLSVATGARTEAQEVQRPTEQEAAGQVAALGEEMGLRVEEAGSPGSAGNPGPLSTAQKRAISQGYLVQDQAAYERAKADAAERARRLSGPRTSSSPGDLVLKPSGVQYPMRQLAPTNFRSWEGANDSNSSVSDSTGAIGTKRYIELINRKIAIYNRTSNAPISTATLNTLVGASSTHEVFDPQIMWDQQTKRFFYAADQVVSSTDNRVAFGFSKTSAPSSAADFCKYFIGFGSRFPDYPKLGDTKNRLLIGANAFDTNDQVIGSDLYSVTKPPTGSTCPDGSTLTIGTVFNLSGAWTPVPANQTDASTTGYVVARNSSLPSNRLVLYDVTENATTGTFNLSARSLTVPTYDRPASAPQPGVTTGATKPLDTLDARNTQAVSAIDPSRGSRGKVAVWTQHTVFGGSGAEVRWYEINAKTSTPSLFQNGSVFGSSGLHVFNAAISPDRKVFGATKAFGDNMVMGFNTSSTNQRPDIRTASKIEANALTFGPVVVASPFTRNDFGCFQPGRPFCRWGDYSAATPDPAAPTGTGITTGQVWLTNMFVRSQGTGSSSPSTWGTWNWAATP
jgi:hypothetical protein